MKISSIEMRNFLSYFNNNRIDFGEGPTIVIGQNRTGKSKLFDAINWVLYDRAYHTDYEKWILTKEWGHALVNNYAKSLCRPGQNVVMVVTLDFDDEDQYKYSLTRECKLRKKENGDWELPRNTTLSLQRIDHITSNSKSFWDKEAEREILLLFPENLSKYFLFQGENISQIMSLNNKSDFIKALQDLSRIKIFDDAKTYTEKVFKIIKKEFEAKIDSNKQIQERKVELSKDIEILREELTEIGEEFECYIKERDIAREVFNRKNEELIKYRECAEVISEISQLTKQKESKIEIRTQHIESQKRNIFDSWMYAGSDRIFENFKSIYNRFKVERKIPEPIRQEFILEMLDAKQCFVCGSSAPLGSSCYHRIQSLRNDKALDKEVELINQLSFVAEQVGNTNGSISTEIVEYLTKKDEYDELIKSIEHEIKVKDAFLKTIKPADISDDDLKMHDFNQLQEDRDSAKKDWDRYEEKIKLVKEKRENKEASLNSKLREYDLLVASASNTREKERFILAEKIQATTAQFYDNFLKKLIFDIETEANRYFIEMTKHNPALSGRVKVDYDLKEVYTIDEGNKRLFNINQANKVSLQISFVAAVLSVSNDFWNTYFPFVADAPISALGGNNKATTIQTMMDIFKQSIIILKDDADTDDPDSLRNDIVRNMVQSSPRVKYAYELKTVGGTVNEQHTKIEILKP